MTKQKDKSPEQALPPGMRDESRRTISNPVIKDSVTFTKYGRETDGQYTELEITLTPGGGNPLHYHTSYTETFLAIDRQVHVRIGKMGERVVLEPGESRSIELGECHSFFNPTDEEVRFSVTIRPASEGFEKMLYILYGLARDGFVNAKGRTSHIEYEAILMVLSDTYLAVVGSSLIGFLGRLVAAYGRWRGMEEDLLRRYWY